MSAITSTQIKMLRKLIQTGSEQNISRAIEKFRPSDLSVLLSEIPQTERTTLIKVLFKLRRAGKTLRELPESVLPDILPTIDDRSLATMLMRLEPDDAVYLVQQIPELRWKQVFDYLPDEDRTRIEQLAIYPKDAVGSVMTPNVPVLKEEQTIEEAVAYVRKVKKEMPLFYLYVLDSHGRFVGLSSLSTLVTEDPTKTIGEVMIRDVRSVNAVDNKERAAEIVSEYNLMAVPVVDQDNRLLGMVTVDDVVDIITDEATRDIYSLAGLSEGDRIGLPVHKTVLRRLPWVIVNLIAAAIAASVVGIFQDSIEKVVALAIFLPIVTNMAGNTGIQSLTVVTRAIALGELALFSAARAILKELSSGVMVGAMVGLLMALGAWVWKGNIYLGLILFFSMILTLLIAGLAGAAVPLALKACRQDPAIGSGVLVTTCSDFFGFLIFLGLATMLMGYLI